MKGKDILIVDDEKLTTETLRDLFDKKGYTVHVAFEGESALQIIKKITPSVVLLDMRLPDVDGIELLKTIRSEYPHIKVVVMTGYDLEYKQRIEAIGCHAFFIKPLLIMELIDKIEELLKTDKAPILKKSIGNYILEEHPYPIPKNLDEFIPKARIALVNIVHPERSLLLYDYFSNPKLCGGKYEIKDTGVLSICK